MIRLSPVFSAALCGGLMMFAAPALAQSIVGTAFVDGKRVDLFNNGTWDFSDTGDVSCQKIATTLSFCGNPFKWKPTGASNDDITAMFRADDLNYGMVIYEGLGLNSGMSRTQVQSIAQEYAAAASQMSVSQVPVFGIVPVTVADHDTETLYYAASIDGLHIVYANTVLVGASDTAQIVTYEIADDINDAFKIRHKDFLDSFKIEFWEDAE